MKLDKSALSFVPLITSSFAPRTTDSVCAESPYDEVLPLSNYPPAKSYCSSGYPPLPCSTVVSTETVTIPEIVETFNVSVTFTNITSRFVAATVTKTVTDGRADLTVFTTTETETRYTSTESGTLFIDDTTQTIYTATKTTTRTSLLPNPTGVTSGEIKGIKVNVEPLEFIKVAGVARNPHNQRAHHAALFHEVTKLTPSLLSTACSCILSAEACSTHTSTAYTTSAAITRTRSVVATVRTPVILTVTTHISAPPTISTDTTSTLYTDFVDVQWGTETHFIKRVSTTTVTFVPPAPSCTAGATCANRDNTKWQIYCSASIKPTSGGTKKTGIRSVTDCLNKCDRDEGCGLFSFDSIKRSCTLYPPDTVPEFVPYAYGASGSSAGPCVAGMEEL